jgi:hypothetical protein
MLATGDRKIESRAGPITDYEEKVVWFAHQMIGQLIANDDKGGWDDESLVYLLDRLSEEVQELKHALIEADKDGIIQEAADVANFAMMIADRVS